MNVLSVTPEIYPLIKTGGLADVAGALPLALAGKGVSMRSLIPGYPAVTGAFRKKKPVLSYPALQGGKASVHAVRLAGLDLFVLDAPYLFDRPGGPYGDATGSDWPDNWRRFAALGQVGADIAAGAVEGYRPDIVHAHDWQSAMTPAYMRYGEAAATPSLVTVHNLAFQGQFGATIFGELGLPAQAMAIDGVEYYGGVGFLKAGLQAASAITTVSPTYAQEIRTPAFGMGLDGLINLRGAAFLSQEVAKAMLKDRPERAAIIFITSASTELVSIDRAQYCVSKLGLSMWARALAVRLAPEGIPVFEVRPGVIRTDMTAKVAARYDARIAEGLIPAGRWGEGDDVAAAVAGLTSGQFAYATGTVINVDGGLLIPRL